MNQRVAWVPRPVRRVVGEAAGFSFGRALVVVVTHDLWVSIGECGAGVVELRIAAQPALVFMARTVASEVARLAGFDLDATSDLRMAVDELCNTLIPSTSPGSVLTCSFVSVAGRVQVVATVPAAPSDAMVDTQSWGWRVLRTLFDEVMVSCLESGEGVRHLQVLAAKLAAPGTVGRTSLETGEVHRSPRRTG